MNKRILWIDWMKTLGMLCIIYGHFSFFPEYVYAFHVPLFFVISGFLSKNEESCQMFIRKIAWNLIVPMFLISLLNYIFLESLGQNRESVAKFVMGLILGLHDSVKEMWFVYTLVLLKIILQFLKGNVFIMYVLIPVALFVSYLLNTYDIVVYGKHILKFHSALLTVFLSYPFFILGFALKKYKNYLIDISLKKSVVLLILAFPIVYFCAKINGCAYLVNHEYGNNLFLFICGAIAGIVLVFAVAKLFSNIKIQGIMDISKGTIIILGFHVQFVVLLCKLYRLASFEEILFVSLVILLIFIPIIRITERFCPILIGKYRI